MAARFTAKFLTNGQNRRTTGKRTPRTETAKPTAGDLRPAHTHRTPGAVYLGARAGGPLRSAAGLFHDPDGLMDAGRLTDRGGHGDPLGVVSVEVSRARARLTILGAIPSVLSQLCFHAHNARTAHEFVIETTFF